MRYKIVIYPLLNSSLAIISTAFDDSMSHNSRYGRTITLKTKGTDWDLPGYLREIADQLDNTD